MSVVPSSNASPAIPDEMTGLEDVEATDFAMPRLSIDHDTGEFVDSLSGERHEKLTGVILGLVKQRVLWPPEMGDDNDPPLCRSYNFQDGHPSDKFPWQASGFDPLDFDDGEEPIVSCGSCPLKEWGSHPNRDIQWCAEQHVYPLLVPAGEGYAPALFTVQRSGIKPSRAYLSSFARSKTPLYTAFTTLSLNGNRRGKVNYYVPSFVKAGSTDQDDWAEYAQSYRGIREFLQTPRTRDDDEGTSAGRASSKMSDSSPSGGSSTSSSPRGKSSTTRGAKPGATEATPADPPDDDGELTDDDDLPF